MTLSPRNLDINHLFWRRGQLETIQQIISSDKHVVIVDAPPGTGKSTIALGTILLENKRGIVLVPTKSLAEQYARESSKVRVLQGQQNFECVLPRFEVRESEKLGVDFGLTVDQAPCMVGYKCPVKSECPYFQQIEEAQRANVVVTTYAYWLRNCPDVNDADWVIADEGHFLLQHDTQANSVTVPLNSLADINNMYIHQVGLRNRMEDPTVIKRKIDIYCETLERAIKYLEEDPELQKTAPVNGNWTIRPTVPKFVQSVVESTKRLLIMSATILDPDLFSHLNEIPEYAYLNLPWNFPKINRPIRYIPQAMVNRRNMEPAAAALALGVQLVLQERPDVKGLIHSVSFDLGLRVYEKLPNELQKRVVLHRSGQNRRDILNEFKRGKDPRWLISPGFGEGEDFPYDIARSQIILKMPYPNLGDSWVRRINAKYPKWYMLTTAQSLWQMYGRVCRAEDDYGESWIFDQHLERFLRDNRLTPDGVREAILE